MLEASTATHTVSNLSIIEPPVNPIVDQLVLYVKEFSEKLRRVRLAGRLCISEICVQSEVEFELRLNRKRCRAIHVHENAENTIHITMPVAPDNHVDLSDDALENVAGGLNPIAVDIKILDNPKESDN